MAVIHLVRHGQASFGAENYDQLSELGVQQCYLLGQWMRDTQQPVEQIVTGAMHRHHQSAQAFWAGYGAPANLAAQHWRVEASLNEFDHEQILKVSRPEFVEPGKLIRFLAEQEQPRAVLDRLFIQGLQRWMSGVHDSDYAESWSAFKTRIATTVDLFIPADRNGMMVFTSGGPISLICQHMLAIPDSHILTLLSSMMNSGVTKIIKSDDQLRLVGTNSIAHLEVKADRSLISYR